MTNSFGSNITEPYSVYIYIYQSLGRKILFYINCSEKEWLYRKLCFFEKKIFSLKDPTYIQHFLMKPWSVVCGIIHIICVTDKVLNYENVNINWPNYKLTTSFSYGILSKDNIWFNWYVNEITDGIWLFDNEHN